MGSEEAETVLISSWVEEGPGSEDMEISSIVRLRKTEACLQTKRQVLVGKDSLKVPEERPTERRGWSWAQVSGPASVRERDTSSSEEARI